jgi:hypothetical protein
MSVSPFCEGNKQSWHPDRLFFSTTASSWLGSGHCRTLGGLSPSSEILSRKRIRNNVTFTQPNFGKHGSDGMFSSSPLPNLMDSACVPQLTAVIHTPPASEVACLVSDLCVELYAKIHCKSPARSAHKNLLKLGHRRPAVMFHL